MIGKLHHRIRLALGPVGSKLPDHIIDGIREKMLEQNPGLSIDTFTGEKITKNYFNYLVIDTFAGEKITKNHFYYLVSEALEALQV